MITTRDRIIATASILILVSFLLGAVLGMVMSNGFWVILCMLGGLVTIVSVVIYSFWS